MSTPLTLSLNGTAPQPLSNFGILDSKLSRRSLQRGEWSFRIAVSDATAVPPFAFDDKLTLYRGTTVHWRGRVLTAAPTISASGESFVYRVGDSWDDLSTTFYQQYRPIAGPDFVTMFQTLSTRVVLGQDGSGSRRTVEQQLRDIVNFAFSQGAGVLPGTYVGAGVNIPWREEVDLTCADAIRRMLAFYPDAVSWFDYTLDPPILNIGIRSALTIKTLDLTARTRIEGASPTKRSDLTPAGITFIYVTSETNPADGLSYTRLTLDRAGATTGRRVLFSTLDMMGLGTDSEEDPTILGAPADAIPYGLAQLYFNSLSIPQWEGQVVVHDAECTGEFSPGQTLNLTNGNAAWATMNALIQSVDEEHDTGKTTISFGPSEVLSASSFAMMTLFNRQPRGGDRPPGGNGFGGTRPPGDGQGTDPNGNKAKQLFNTAQITGCVSGVDKTITVLVP